MNEIFSETDIYFFEFQHHIFNYNVTLIVINGKSPLNRIYDE